MQAVSRVALDLGHLAAGPRLAVELDDVTRGRGAFVETSAGTEGTGGELVTTDEGWTLRVLSSADRVEAACTFFGWTAAVQIRLGHADAAAVAAALRRARVVCERPCALAQMLGVRSTAEVRPLPGTGPPDFAGWTRRHVGDDVELCRDDGAATFLVRELAAPPPGPVAGGEPFFTGSGDVGLRVRSGAWIAGDHGHTVVMTTATRAAAAGVSALLDRFLFQYSFGAPEERLRRFLYLPPPGWLGVPRGLAGEWFAPGVGRIIVYPAHPHAGRREVATDLLLRGPMPEQGPRAVEPVSGPHGLDGVRSVAPQADGHVEELRFSDARFGYAFRLETTRALAPLHGRVLARVAESLVPIPSAD
jgi:hypothetical protein